MKTIRSLPLLLAATLAASAALPPPEEAAPGQRPPHRHIPQPHRLPPFRGPARFGDPLPGLTGAQKDAFTTGLGEFTNVEKPETGLGPIFNNVSCVACHSAPAVGGSSVQTVTRFGHTTGGTFDPLADLGGSLLQAKAIDPDAREVVPPEANVRTLRQSMPLFGLGLIEAIPDDAIKRNAARFPADFAFQLTEEGYEILKSQVVTSSVGSVRREAGMWSQNVTTSSPQRRRLSNRPWAFTEHGAVMAANVLRSPRAVEVSVYVVRAFVAQREALATNATILKRLADGVHSAEMAWRSAA